MKWKIVTFNILFSINIFMLFGEHLFVQNTIDEINKCQNWIELQPIRTWGGDETDDENQFFRFPRDIKIDKIGNVYIVDSGNNRIQVFDGAGNYTKTLGRIGQGPGDLLLPNFITFDQGNRLVVSDSQNNRIQLFDITKGNHISSFKIDGGPPSFVSTIEKNQFLVYSYQRTLKRQSLATLYDCQGKIKREIGEHYNHSNSSEKLESIFITLDSQNNLWVSYRASLFLQKISFSNTPLRTVIFGMPKESPGNRFKKVGKELKRTGGVNKLSTFGLALDQRENLYLAVAKRSKKKSEVYYLVSDGDGTLRRWPKTHLSDKTDRFQLLVFSPQGKIIASKSLGVYCDGLYIHHDRLFIIDTYVGMKIHEYRIHFNEANRTL